jgi:beta-N-acetylhexosaminidase
VDLPVLTTLLPGFAGTTLPDWLEHRLRAGLGAVCLFASNIDSLPQLRALTDAIYAANPRALIAIDEEGGDVTRLFHQVGSPFPGNAVLGRIDDLSATRASAEAIGWELRRSGVNVDFAPTADINSNPDNPVIGVRSFGVNPQRVAEHTAAWIAGLQSTGVAATAKHFPGHGDTSQDSHVSLPVVDRSLDELRQRELIPFAAAVGAGTRLVMTSHILLPQLDDEHPATMSHDILAGLLRAELGFSGVIVTDALDMAGASAGRGIPDAAVGALRAGCDLLCIGTDNTDEQLAEIATAVTTAVADGSLDAERVNEAASRVLTLADDLVAAAPAVPERARGAWPGGGLAVIDAFDIQPTARTWRTRPAARFTIVRLDTHVSPAIGNRAPWGPFAAALEQPQVVVSAERPPPTLAPDEPVVIIGRDIHRHAFARTAVDRLRERHRHVLVVDMGWPSDDRRYADVATFGASALIGQALWTYLTGETRPASGLG